MYRQHTDALMSSALLRETAGINCPHWPWRWRCLHPWLPWCVSASRSSPGLPGNQTWRGTAAHTLQPQHSCITGRKQTASTGTQLNSISRPDIHLDIDQEPVFEPGSEQALWSYSRWLLLGFGSVCHTANLTSVAWEQATNLATNRPN